MPTYEYVCEKCGYSFELFQPITAAPLTVCSRDVCPQKKWAKGRVTRQISAGAGLLFKGSGFYITDYRSEGYKAAAKKESGGSSGNSSGGEGKSAGGEGKSSGATSPGDAKGAKADSKPAKPTKAAKTS